MLKSIAVFAFMLIGVASFAQEEAITIEDYPLKLEWKKSDLENLSSPEAITNCDEKGIEWLYVDKQFSGGPGGVVERTWMAEDKCGNKASTVQYIVLTK
jgi:hypothetical protein